MCRDCAVQEITKGMNMDVISDAPQGISMPPVLDMPIIDKTQIVREVCTNCGRQSSLTRTADRGAIWECFECAQKRLDAEYISEANRLGFSPDLNFSERVRLQTLKIDIEMKTLRQRIAPHLHCPTCGRIREMKIYNHDEAKETFWSSHAVYEWSADPAKIQMDLVILPCKYCTEDKPQR